MAALLALCAALVSCGGSSTLTATTDTTTTTVSVTTTPSTTAVIDDAKSLDLTLAGLEGLTLAGDQQRIRVNGSEDAITLWSGVDGIQASYLKLLVAPVPGFSGPEGNISATPIAVPSGTAWLVADNGDTASLTSRIMWWRNDGRLWVVTQHGLSPERLTALTLTIQQNSGLPYVLPDPSMKFVLTAGPEDPDAIRQDWTLAGSHVMLELATPGLVHLLNGAETSIAARTVRGQPGYAITLGNGQIDVTWPSGGQSSSWFALYISPPLASRANEIINAITAVAAG